MNQFEYRVSVIVPIYNAEKYLKDCLDSLLIQTIDETQMEVILIDDGSTDSSQSICSEYVKENSIFKLFTTENRGASNARNFGMQQATGKYLLFVDADDTINFEYIASMVKFMDMHYDEIDLAISRKVYPDKVNSQPDSIRDKYLVNTGIYDIEKIPYILPKNINICVKNTGLKFDTNMDYQEVEEFCIRSLKEKLKIGYVKEAEYCHRIHESSLDSKNSNPIQCFEAATRFYEEQFAREEENIPKYIQALFIHDFVCKFRVNQLWPYHYSEEALHVAKERIKMLLLKVDNSLIIGYPGAQSFEWLYWLKLKGANITTSVEKDGMKVRCEGKEVYKRRDIEIVLIKIRVNKERVLIRGYVKSPVFSFGVTPDLQILINGDVRKVECVDCGAGYYRSKEKTNTFYGFEIVTELQRELSVEFKCSCEGISYPITFIKVPSVALSENCKEYLVNDTLVKEIGRKLIFSYVGDTKTIAIKRELAKYKDEKIRKIISNVFYNCAERIWLYMDGPSVTRDNGMIQFMHDKDIQDGIQRYYVITNASTPISGINTNQLVKFGSEKHIELFFKAEKLLTSFMDDAVIWPIVKERRLYRGLFSAELVYLQHGILHAKLPWYYSKYTSLIDKVVVSSEFEKNNLVKNYDYDEEDLLFSGMPRLDMLKKHSMHTRKILYAPSWRSYLVNQKLGDVIKRSQNMDKFMESNYCKGIMELIGNERLNDYLHEQGLTLEIKLHPEFYELYNKLDVLYTDNVELVKNEVDINLYDMIITDFSSLLFDFVYMNKPIVYYLPDADEFNCGMNHYRCLDMPFTEGMGDYTADVEKAVETIIKLANNNFRVSDKYEQKYQNFYQGLEDSTCDKLYKILNPENAVSETEGEMFAAFEGEILEEDSFTKFKRQFEGFDKDHVWMFDAGNAGRREFRGNPKYLFAYINRYRPDIKAYWLCEPDAEKTIEFVRNLNYTCLVDGTPEADYAMERTGVIVSELVRMYIPDALANAKYVNLWHGIGFKRIERAITLESSDLSIEMAKKYITNNSFYMDNQMLSVSSPTYEEEFIEDFGLDRTHLIRTGYLRCMYQQNYEPICTFDHDLLGVKGLPEDTVMAVYAPTYRAQRGNAFNTGIKDLEKLYKVCEENHILLIFKVHPYIENETGFLNAWKQYGDRPYFWFWNNADDFYEIMDKVDLVIYDYSSIFADFLCAGVKNFIRYVYDEDEYMLDGFTQGKEAYYERTCGITCRSFDDLLNTISHYREIDNTEEIQQIYQKLWAYAGDDDFEKTIKSVMDFKVVKKEHPTLYSFDIFDTLLSRKGLHPYSIFYAVRERMKKSGGFSDDLIDRYPQIRHSAEMNVREYYRKTTEIRQSNKIEITLPEIFERIMDVYDITEDQAIDLMQWEIEKEIASVIPLKEQIDLLKDYLAKGNTVLLISDMYLPMDVITEMLRKADPILVELPLFLSSEYGVQKTTSRLYFEVYKSFKPFFRFGKWIHHGDNVMADQTAARKLGIQTRRISKPEFSVMEDALVNSLNNHDGYLVAAMQARLREKSEFSVAEFVVDFVGLAMLPYVDWVIRDALKKGFDTLYFVARDGHPLKLIADALIETHKWNIKTKYIYASRRTWRIQSYFDKVDDIFWISQGGSFNDIASKEELFKAMYIDEETFRQLLPQIDLDGIDWNANQPGRMLAPLLRESEAYNNYLLKVAEKERVLPCEYLKQEIDSSEKFACVEYWGRGYNQECMSRLWNYVIGREDTSYYYYARTICPTEGKCVRYNFTDNNSPLIFMEAIFANMPYRSVENYKQKAGKIEPVIEGATYDRNLYIAMNTLLPQLAKEYAQLELSNPVETDRKLFDFLLQYYNDNKDLKLIADNIGGLKDSPTMYGERKEFAQAYNMSDLKKFKNGEPRGKNTSSILMSYARANDDFKREYDEMYQLERGDNPAGGVPLNDVEIAKNRELKKKYENSIVRARNAAIIYEKACIKKTVFRKVCVVTAGKDFENDTLRILRRKLLTQDEVYVEWISALRKESEDAAMMEQIATAEYIIVDGCVPQFFELTFREETTVIGLLDRAFRLYNYGHTFQHKLKWQVRNEALNHSLRANAIESPEAVSSEITLKAYGLDTNSVKKLEGACITDVLYDEDFRREALEKLHDIFPESEGKKVIVYMPTMRKRFKSQEWLELLDMERLYELIGDEYVVAMDLSGGNALLESCRNIVEIQGFSKIMNGKDISLRSLLVTADIVIGDYRDTFFESALLGKPVFSTATDSVRTQTNSINMARDLQSMYPFPIIHNVDELTQKLNNLRGYDFSVIRKFSDNYLSGCDGHVSDRILDILTKN